MQFNSPPGARESAVAPPTRWAFKEWAAVCAALAAGRQTIVLRKGGIAERHGAFHAEHDRFWLLRTGYHQTADQLAADAGLYIHAANASAPPPGNLLVSEFAVVESVWWVDRLDVLAELQPLHCWAPEVIHQRFHYRQPGLYVLLLRVFRRAAPAEIVETTAIAGCRSWVELDDVLPVTDLTPALAAQVFATVADQVRSVLALPRGAGGHKNLGSS
jgi:hypothetical protein